MKSSAKPWRGGDVKRMVEAVVCQDLDLWRTAGALLRHSSHEIVRPTVSEENLRRLETLLGVSTPDNGLRDEICSIIGSYVAFSISFSPASERERRKQIAAVEAAACDLRQALAGLDWVALAKMTRRSLSSKKRSSADMRAARDELLGCPLAVAFEGRAQKVVAAVWAARHRSPYARDNRLLKAAALAAYLEFVCCATPAPKRGRPPINRAKLLMLISIADLYRARTGNDAKVSSEPVSGRWHGQFYDVARIICTAAASAVGEKYQGDKALGRALKTYRRRLNWNHLTNQRG
jgi:hypothetical protein